MINNYLIIKQNKKLQIKLHHLTSLQVLIVQDAYQQQNEWSSALYNNVVLQGNFKYLEDFQSCIQLTAGHCTDVASRYGLNCDQNES